MFARFSSARPPEWADSTTKYAILGPDRHVVVDEFPNLSSGTLKATQLNLIRVIGEDVVKLRQVPSDECVKFNTMFLSKNTNLID